MSRLYLYLFVIVAIFIPLSANAESTWYDEFKQKLGYQKATPQLTILFVDHTSSIVEKDKSLYQQASERSATLQSYGDHYVVGEIGGLPISRFTLHADVPIAARSGHRFKDERMLQDAQKKLRETVAQLLQTPAPGGGTFILDALCAIRPLLNDAKKSGMRIKLILLTDGIEESDLNLNHANISADEVKRALNKRTSLLPDLSGVDVKLIGAGGIDAQHYAEVQKFWRDFIVGRGGQLSHYGRTLPDFK